MTDNKTRFITQTVKVEVEIADPLFCDQHPITLESVVDGGKTLSLEFIDESGERPRVVPVLLSADAFLNVHKELIQSGRIKTQVHYNQAQVAAMEAKKKALPPAPEEEPTVLDVDAVDEGYTDLIPANLNPKLPNFLVKNLKALLYTRPGTQAPKPREDRFLLKR